MSGRADGHWGRKLFIPIVLIAVLAALSSVWYKANTETTSIRNGMADLASWDMQEGVRALNGEWEFYWNRLLEYRDFQSGSRPQPDRLAVVPENWTDYEIEGERLQESGFATYRLQVNVPEAGRTLVLKFLPVSSAYGAYVNDQLLVTVGSPGTNPGSFLAETRPMTVEFATPGERFELIVHVSNFGLAKAGMNHSVMIGTPDQMLAFDNRLVYKDLFVLGSLALAAFYSLSMYWMNREERISLYFGCVCLIFIGRIVMTGSYFIYAIAPHASIGFQTYLNYFTSHWGSLVFSLMIREFFPNEYSGRIRRYFIAMTAVILTIITIVPAHLYSRHYLLSDLLCLAVLGYAYYAAARAVINKRPFAILSFGANSLCLLLVIVDFYYAATNHAGKSNEFSTLGFFAFVVLYAFILGRRSSLAYNEVRVLSRRLLELDKLKDEFLANTSHELKTPLHGMIGLAESLLQGVEGQLSGGQRKNMELIASSGRKLSQLIHDILDMSKLKHGGIALSRRSVRVLPLVESVLLVFRNMYPHKRLVWTVDIPPSLSPVYADENRLVQIVYNLVGNAVKFTDEGEIQVAAREKDGFVQLDVSDTGIGIRADQLDTIFLAFEQADSSITREYGGVGLGLSITKHLVELHGGRIEVASAPGEGSCFTVLLPVGDGNEAEPQAGSVMAHETVLESHSDKRDEQTDIAGRGDQRILVVDDDYTSLQAAVNLLRLEGYSVTAVTSGKAALERIQQTADYELVILDVMMPELSGYEVCRRIRETKSLVDLPVLLVTAKHQSEDLVLGFDSGANDFLVKPFEPAEFRARVKTLMEWNQSMKRAFQSEMAFLQAQIKPHFIYNTLSTISYFCTRDAAKAKELLNHFSDYLRGSFDFRHTEKVVPLEKELRIVATYLEIEKERFESRLQVRLDVDPDARGAMVPSFIVQPLVENAVVHGVLKKPEGGAVHISVRRDGPELQFRVRDSGAGMEAEQVARVLSEAHGSGSGVGLRNTRERLKKLYGSDITIRSEAGKGTEVAFTIPAAGVEGL